MGAMLLSRPAPRFYFALYSQSLPVDGPKFLQLLPSELTAVAECAIECQDAKGATIRIHLKGPQLPALAALSSVLWSSDR